MLPDFERAERIGEYWGDPNELSSLTGQFDATVLVLAAILVTSLELARSEVPVRLKYLIRPKFTRYERDECLSVEFAIDRRREPFGFSGHPRQGNPFHESSRHGPHVVPVFV